MKVVHANHLLDNGGFSPFHYKMLLWCFLIILFDGYDTAIYGAVVPVLMEEWSLTPVQTGAIGSYTVIGTVIGAIGMSIMADKIGPKKIVIASVAIFSVLTCLSGLAANPVTFGILRFLAGIGLGGVMPNVIALTTEFSPKKFRSTMVALVFCGYAFGSMSVALLGKFFIGTLGWQSLFYFAALPLVLLPFMVKSMPESLRVHAKKGDNKKIHSILKQAVPDLQLDPATVFEKPAMGKNSKITLRNIMGEKRAVSTVMFWIASFSCFVLIYAMNTWLTKLMNQAGYNLSSSLLFLAVLNVGAIIATIIGGPLMDRFGSKKVVVPLFLAGSIAVLVMGQTNNMLFAYGLVAVVGAGCIGIQNLLNPVVSQFYPPEIRSTAVGIMMAFGRLGGVLSPTLVGLLMSYNFSVELNFMVIAIPGLLGAVALFFIQQKHSYHAKEEQTETDRAEKEPSVEQLGNTLM